MDSDICNVKLPFISDIYGYENEYYAVSFVTLALIQTSDDIKIILKEDVI